ncbi:hypothetical protein PCK1_002578 [Pneumocystis canis]|nr:hypothetical protein PCK1_002578 [Pneumocystis canis]
MIRFKWFSRISRVRSYETASFEPVSSSYFTGKERFYDDCLAIETILKRYQTLPRRSPDDISRPLWKTLSQYQATDSALSHIKPSKYRILIQMLNKIDRIDPAWMPQEARDILSAYTRETLQTPVVKQQKQSLDGGGRSRTIGRRKEAVSNVWMIKGDGQILVNGKSLFEAFSLLHDRESLIWPLKVTQRLFHYNLWIRVKGGGMTGQAEASALAISRALIIHEPELQPVLRKMSCLTCDARRVERKKPGQPKARKKNAWVKR